jgi:hypothetical protein
MSVGNYVLDKGRKPESALTIYRACKVGSAEESVTAVTADTDLLEGVVQFGVSAGELTKGKLASVRMEGITPWEAGAAITKGALVTIDASGRCIAATTGKRVHGRALYVAANSGDVIGVELMRNAQIV